jgi:hypothetical protein
MGRGGVNGKEKGINGKERVQWEGKGSQGSAR